MADEDVRPPSLPPQQSGPGLLERILPLISFGSIAALQGPAAAGGFGQGFVREKGRQEAIGLQRDEANRRRDLLELQQRQLAVEAQKGQFQQRRQAATFIQRAIEEASKLNTREEAIAFLRAQDLAGSSQGLTLPGQILAAPLPRGFFSAKERAANQARLKTIIDNLGPQQFNDLISRPLAEQPTLDINGQQIPLEQYATQFAGAAAMPNGEMIELQTPGKTDFERRMIIEEDAFEAEHGRTPNKQERADIARRLDGVSEIRQETDLLRADLLRIQLEMERRLASGIRPPTNQEKIAVGFGSRAVSGHTEAMAVESQFEQLSGQATLSQLIPNFLRSDAAQQYRRAQREFTEARLRKESGAAIKEEEYRGDALTYFIQPGDTPATIRLKQLARARIVQGLAFSAGPAWKEFFGRPFIYDDYVPQDELLSTDGDESSASSALDKLGF